MLKKNFVAFIFIFANFTFEVQGQLFILSGSFNDLNSPITSLKISPKGKLLIAGDANGFISFRDAVSGQHVISMKAFDSAVECINFNSTGELMVIASPDGEIKIYDFRQSKFIHSLYSPAYSGIRFALFSIADGFIYFNSQGRLYKSRSDLSQIPAKVYQFDSAITNAVVTSDRSALIFSCENSMYVLNTRTDVITQQLTTSPSPIEQIELTTNSRIVSWRRDGTIAIHHYELNQLNSNPSSSFKAGSSSKFAFSHDGQLMVSGKTGTWARIWKPMNKSIIQEIFGHKGAVTNFTFSLDDRMLFTSSEDRSINVWQNMETPFPESLSKAKTNPETNDSVAISSDVPDAMGNEMPAIVLDQKNIPTSVGGRNVNRATEVFVSQQNLEISVYDNSILDGDILSLSFQNKWILTKYPVTKDKMKITLQLTPGSNNCLVLYADNLGKTPPNTAVISFNQNGKENIFRLESDLKSCSAINFIYNQK